MYGRRQPYFLGYTYPYMSWTCTMKYEKDNLYYDTSDIIIIACRVTTARTISTRFPYNATSRILIRRPEIDYGQIGS